MRTTLVLSSLLYHQRSILACDWNELTAVHVWLRKIITLKGSLSLTSPKITFPGSRPVFFWRIYPIFLFVVKSINRSSLYTKKRSKQRKMDEFLNKCFRTKEAQEKTFLANNACQRELRPRLDRFEILTVVISAITTVSLLPGIWTEFGLFSFILPGYLMSLQIMWRLCQRTLPAHFILAQQPASPHFAVIHT